MHLIVNGTKGLDYSASLPVTSRRGMIRPTLAAWLAALWLFATPWAGAQPGGMTAYAGFSGGGNGLQRSTASTDQALQLDAGTAASFSVEWTLDAARQLQWFVSRQNTTLETQPAASTLASQRIPLQVIYVHLGGTNFIESRVGLGPYVAGGLGFTRFSPGLSGFESELRMSMNLGLGYAWPLSPQLGLRVELRGYATLINSSGSFLCSGGCTVSIKGDTLTQSQALLGLAFSF